MASSCFGFLGEVDTQRTLHLSNELEFIYKQHARCQEWKRLKASVRCLRWDVDDGMVLLRQMQGPWLWREISSLRQGVVRSPLFGSLTKP